MSLIVVCRFPDGLLIIHVVLVGQFIHEILESLCILVFWYSYSDFHVTTVNCVICMLFFCSQFTYSGLFSVRHYCYLLWYQMLSSGMWHVATKSPNYYCLFKSILILLILILSANTNAYSQKCHSMMDTLGQTKKWFWYCLLSVHAFCLVVVQNKWQTSTVGNVWALSFVLIKIMLLDSEPAFFYTYFEHDMHRESVVLSVQYFSVEQWIIQVTSCFETGMDCCQNWIAFFFSDLRRMQSYFQSS